MAGRAKRKSWIFARQQYDGGKAIRLRRGCARLGVGWPEWAGEGVEPRRIIHVRLAEQRRQHQARVLHRMIDAHDLSTARESFHR